MVNNKEPLLSIKITRIGAICKVRTQTALKKLANYFTIKHKTIMGYVVKKKTYTFNNEGELVLPRFGAFLLENKYGADVVYTVDIPEPEILNNLTWTGQMTGNQPTVFNHIINNIYNTPSNGKAGLILNLEAGQGKTFLAMSMISHLKHKTLIITHNTGILDQWRKLLNQYFTNATIGLYYGKKKDDVSECDIMLGVINSLVRVEDPDEFYKDFGFCVFDECHEYCGNERSKIFNLCQSKYMLGLSATPEERADGMDKVVRWSLGPILNARELEAYTEEDIPFKGKVYKIDYRGPTEYTEHIINETTGMVNYSAMINQITSDPYRIKLIVQKAIELQDTGLNVFVFADRRSYLAELQKYITDSIILTDDEADTVVGEADTVGDVITCLLGGAKSEDIERAEKSARVILTTYQYMGTGKSIPKMNCIILATPRKTKSRQFINRIFRLGSDYSIERVIIDIVDSRTSLKTQWYKRLEYYNEKKYDIDTINAPFIDYV